MVKEIYFLLIMCMLSCCVTDTTTTTTSTTQQYYCGVDDSCEDGECYLFPEMSYPICFEGNPCSRCPSGRCLELESYPVQIQCLPDTTTSTSTTTSTTTEVPEEKTDCDDYCKARGYPLGGSCQLNSFECSRRMMDYVPTRKIEPCPDRRLDTCCCKTDESIEI